jgi:uncharacterized protein YgiM (DUF1202 family)
LFSTIITYFPTTLLIIPLLIAAGSFPFSTNVVAQEQQYADNCRRVSASYGLNVRQDASEYSPIIGRLANGARVFILNRGRDGWVPINDPVSGYISASYLKLCSSAVPPANCRRVSAPSGLYVRQTPSIYGSVVRTLDNGRFVNIVDRGMNGWVSSVFLFKAMS